MQATGPLRPPGLAPPAPPLSCRRRGERRAVVRRLERLAVASVACGRGLFRLRVQSARPPYIVAIGLAVTFRLVGGVVWAGPAKKGRAEHNEHNSPHLPPRHSSDLCASNTFQLTSTPGTITPSPLGRCPGQPYDRAAVNGDRIQSEAEVDKVELDMSARYTRICPYSMP